MTSFAVTAPFFTITLKVHNSIITNILEKVYKIDKIIKE